MIVNGQWVDEYNQNNWSYGPGGGQGLFNPGRQNTYWNQGTPSFTAPRTPNINGVQIGPTQYGATAPGWVSGGGGNTNRNTTSPYTTDANGISTLPASWWAAHPPTGPVRPLGPAGGLTGGYNSLPTYGSTNPTPAGPGTVAPGGTVPGGYQAPGATSQNTASTFQNAAGTFDPSKVTGGTDTQFKSNLPGQVDPNAAPNTTNQSFMQSLQDMLSQLNNPSGQGYGNITTPSPAGGTRPNSRFNSLPTYGFYAA